VIDERKDIMNRLRAILTVCVLAFGLVLAGNAWAQLGGILSAVPRPSAYPADWQSTPTLATMLIVSNQPATCYLEVFLSSDKGSGVSTPKFQYVPTGSTNYYTQHLTNWNLHLTGKLQEGFERTGRIPDGTYVLTVHCFNVMSVSGQPLPDLFASTTFTISVPQPPNLLYPTNESVIAVANPVFQWTPSIRASGSQPAYRFRLVEMLQGQTPLRAIEGNVPLYESSVESGTALSYPAAVPQLVDGGRYAWRVQAVEPVSAQLPQDVILPVGTNEGKSQVFTFTYRANVGSGGSQRLGQGPGASPNGHASLDAPAPPSDGLPRSPGSGGLKNFADRLLHTMVGRWSPNPSRAAPRAGFASATSTRADPEPYGPSAPAAAPDTAVAAPADTAAAVVPPPAPAPAATPGPEDRGLGPQWLKLHGTASVADETYSREGSGAPTRPFHSARVTTGLSFGLMNDRMRMPFDALVSGDQVSFRENINQFALHPQFNWAGLQAGHFAPQYSTFTLADAMVLGAGFELTPSKWRIGFADGKSRKAIAPDPSVAIQPQFARNILAGRVGYGDPLNNTLEVSVLHAKDNRNSLSAPSDSLLEVTAEANTVYGMKAQGVLPHRHLKAQVEGAWSIYDRDQRADNPNLKGRAVALKLFRETVLTSVGASFELLDGGFMSLGNSGITNDRRDFGFTGRAQLPSGKLSLNANAGWRTDNVSKVMLAGTERRNYSLNASWLPRPNFGADFQLGYLSDDVGTSDSVASTSNITRIVALSPHLTYTARGIQQTLTASATIQGSDNNTTAPFPLTSSHSLCLVGNWSAAVSPLLALTFGGNYNRTDLQIAVSEISAFGPGFVWSIPRAKIATSAQLDFTRSRTGNLGTDTQFAPRCELRWQATPHHALIARGNFRRYRYAVGTPEFDERIASLEYAVTL